MNEQQFLEQLSRLIAYKTIAGQTEVIADALDYVESLVSHQAIVKRFQAEDAEVLLLSNHDTMQPDVAYLVHLDVVPGRDYQWEMKHEGDNVYGRGVSDMKFSIPLGVALLNELLERKSLLKFTLAITTDEETQGNGAKFLAHEAEFLPKILIVPDGGDGGHLIYKSKGYCHLEVISTGVPGHGSTTWKGKNALIPLIKLSHELLAEFEESNKIDGWQTTLNIGYLQGGEAVNQVCDEARLGLDFRFPETQTAQTLIEKVKDQAKKIDENLVVRIINWDVATYTNPELSVVKTFVNSMEGTLVEKMIIRGTNGGSDASHFAHLKVPILMTKSEGDDIHGDHEWLSVSSTMKFYEALQKFLRVLEESVDIIPKSV